MTDVTRTMRSVSLAGVMLMGASALEAQACLGLADLAKTPKTVAATGAGTSLGRTLVARYGMSGERVFGGAQAGLAGDKFAGLSELVVGADVGYVVPLRASGATQLCPSFETTYQNGPSGGYFMQSRLASTLSLSLGRAFAVSSSVAIVPFVQGGVLRVSQGYAFAANPGLLGPNGQPRASSSGHWNSVVGEMAAGLGLRLSDRMTVTPTYRMPLSGFNRAGVYQQTYSLGVTLGFPK